MLNSLFNYIFENEIKLVGFCGKSGSGKTHIANQLTGLFSSNGYTVLRLAFASYIKNIVREIWGLRKDEVEVNFNSKRFVKFIEELKTKFPSKIDIIDEAVIDLIEITKLLKKEDKPITRQLYQYIGTDLIRSLDINFHVNKLKEKFLIFTSTSLVNNSIVIVDDVRFENEAEFIISNNGILCKVVRHTESNSSHSSENVNLDKYVKFVIQNDIAL
jgi:tRNA uridine 5-carbamoylmethylation protein Kti12